MIVAQAVATDVALAAPDRVFRRVKGLKVEDWSSFVEEDDFLRRAFPVFAGSTRRQIDGH
jgi:hypothetical protein